MCGIKVFPAIFFFIFSPIIFFIYSQINGANWLDADTSSF